MLKKTRLNGLAATLALTGVLAAPVTSAQVLEEILVIAQKRVEGLEDVPLSMQVVSGEELDQGNIFSFRDLVERLPNVNFGASPGISTIYIRGIGTGATNDAAEQSVGMYIDGVYVNRGFQFNAPFLDIERVEVLKGPQGVLQGKNSVAGAVVITTRRPAEETEGYIRTSYEVENEGYNLESAVSGALTDKLFARLSGQYNFAGGWIDTNTRIAADNSTVLQGKDDQNENTFYVARLSTVWRPTELLELFLKLETGKVDRDGVWFGGYAIQPDAIVGGPENDQTLISDDFQLRDPNYGFITDGVASNGFRNEYNEALNQFEATNRSRHQKIWSDSATFVFDREFGELGTLTGISGYSVYKEESYTVNSMAPIDWLTQFGKRGSGGEEFDQFTQEIRLVSPTGNTIDYLVGGFYLDRTIERDGSDAYLNFSNGGLGSLAEFDFSAPRHFKEDTQDWSVFAQATWNITDVVRLNAGARYSDETKKLDHNYQAEFLVISPLNQVALDTFGFIPFTTQDLPRHKVSDTNIDPSASLQWDATDNLMLYVSYTQATKAGGFNSSANRPDNSSFDPEKATGVEAGFKGIFVDGRLAINLSVFETDYDDLQVSALDSNTTSFFFKNAAKATTNGVEADFRFAATDTLELGGAMAYLDASYDDFPGATCSTGTSREADCDSVTESRNAAGDTLAFAPEWSGTLYADYRWQFANGMELGLRGDFIYSDEYYIATQNDPYLLQDSFTKLDLVASLTSASGDWTVSAIGKNVTDETTVSFGGGTPLYNGAYWANVDAPRLVYLKVEYTF